jgi:hypothetical protein
MSNLELIRLQVDATDARMLVLQAQLSILCNRLSSLVRDQEQKR